ncbi:MAG: hypothetical protein GY835_07440 [bacterium]|nr:hypothetical protein [bacterium]
MIINVAGRQRMLTQKMSNEALSVMFNDSGSTAKTTLNATATLFDKTHNALLHGGITVAGGGNQITLARTEDPHVRTQLETVDSMWSVFHERVLTIVRNPIDSEESLSSLTFILDNSLRLLGEMDKAVSGFDALSRAKVARLKVIQITFLCAAFILAGIGWTIVSKMVLKPLSRVVEVVNSAANRNLTKVVGLSGDDEIKILSSTVDSLINIQRIFVDDIRGSSKMLNDSAGQLNNNANDLAEDSNTLSDVVSTVSSASEEMTSNIQSIADSSGEMSSMLAMVATSIEEMSSSINEVAGNSVRGSEIANRADQQARQTMEIMNRLRDSSQEIGKVLTVISDIADQTNLLALNATIEAASAGEAGRGFAVVANEVKELARQTAQATEEIKRQVESVQEGSESAVEAIDSISAVIAEVNEISTSIASAVEEQSATATEISHSGKTASNAAQEITRRVAEGAQGIQEVSRNVVLVNETAKRTDSGIQQTREQAEHLTNLSTALNENVNDFVT